MGQHKELYPGFRKEARAAAKRAQGMSEAAAEPLPGPLREAFAPEPVQAGGLRVRPLVHYDFVILRRLDSPLLKQLAAAADKARGRKKSANAETPWTDEDGYEMIYQFTRPAEEVAAFFARYGVQARARFREVALREIGFKLGPVEVAALIPAVVSAFMNAFSTRVKFEPKDPGGDGGFQSPPPGATASAGGSITSAGS